MAIKEKMKKNTKTKKHLIEKDGSISPKNFKKSKGNGKESSFLIFIMPVQGFLFIMGKQAGILHKGRVHANTHTYKI